jgi:hypothetical protein
MNFSCPDCLKLLAIHAKNCTCGWSKPESKIIGSLPDHRCIYQYNGKRCPYPGDISPSTHAATMWYCIEHYRNRGDTERCVQIINDAEKDYLVVMEERIDWSIKLIPEEYEKAKKMIREQYYRLFKK